MEAGLFKEKACRALMRAEMWLSKFGLERAATLDVEGLSLALFGVACSIRPKQSGGSTSEGEEVIDVLAGELDRRFAASTARATLELIRNRSIIPLLAAAAAPQARQSVFGLRARLLNAWNGSGLSSKGQDRTPMERLARAVLELVAGYPLNAALPPMGDWELSLSVSPYATSEEQIIEVVAELNARSTCGQRAPSLKDTEHAFLIRSLPLWTFLYLKDRNLEMVNPLLRAMRQIRLSECEEFHHGLKYVLDAQKSDGHFGEHEIVFHVDRQEGQPRVDVGREVSLRLTVGCVWTLFDCAFPERGLFDKTDDHHFSE